MSGYGLRVTGYTSPSGVQDLLDAPLAPAMLYHMGRTSRQALRTGGRIYGGWISLCLWIAFVLPVYVLVGACILGHTLVMSVIVIVKHFRGTDTPTPRDGRTAARFEGQARYSNRR